MKPEIREFIGTHQLFFESIEKEEIIANIGKIIGASAPTVYKFIEKGVNCGIIKKEGKNVFKENIGNFVGIYLTDRNMKIRIFDTHFNEIDFKVKERHGDFQKREIANVLMELKKQYQFLYTAVVVDIAVKNGGQIGFGIDSYNMFNCPELLSEQDCIFVNSTVIKMIYIRQFITDENNLLYYNLRFRQFSMIEDNQLKERLNDEYYGILPHFRDKNEIMQRLFELKDEQYDAYYQENKDKIFSYIVPDIYAMLSMLRPEKLYLDSEIIKPEYIVQSNVYQDIDRFCFQNILGIYNMYEKPILFINPTDREILKAAAKYAKYKFLNGKLIW